jgi:hypothetical protein
MNCRNIFLSLLIAIFANHSMAQEISPVKFGEINVKDFQLSAPAFDSNASAFIIADIGNTTVEGNRKGFFRIVYTRFTRVKIVNKNGFRIADNSIWLRHYKDENPEEVTELKGITYNLENGIVIQTLLDASSIFEEKYAKYRNIEKFTMPALKEGSIYDLTYTVKSRFFYDPPAWDFQSDFPCLWSEYQVSIPGSFHYMIKIKGDDHFDIKTSKAVWLSYNVFPDAGVMSGAYENRWVKKNVPAILEQPYVSTTDNYKSSLFFELSYFQQDNESPKQDTMRSWKDEAHQMLLNDDFGEELGKNNAWMDDALASITTGASNNEDEVKRIYHFVRDHFLCTDHNSIYRGNSLKDVYKKGAGNVAELNLLLVAMLQHRNIDANPAILSTRENGVSTPGLTLPYEYNYVICVVNLDGKMITLDVSQPMNGFGKLPGYCYNWTARIISDSRPDLISLSPDSVNESKMTSVMISNDEKGNLTGTLNTTYGDAGSFDIRQEVKKTSGKEYFKKIKPLYANINLSNEQFDSLDQLDKPLGVSMDLDFKSVFKDADLVYFNPIIAPTYTSNPFTAATRLYPVEMPHKMDDMYVLTMEIPQGYKVDEIPKSARVNFNENDGFFEYLIQQNGNNIQMRVHLKFKKATFGIDDYATLRDFFAFVVKKESEQIVFKKIK